MSTYYCPVPAIQRFLRLETVFPPVRTRCCQARVVAPPGGQKDGSVGWLPQPAAADDDDVDDGACAHDAGGCVTLSS